MSLGGAGLCNNRSEMVRIRKDLIFPVLPGNSSSLSYNSAKSASGKLRWKSLEAHLGPQSFY